MPTINKPIRKTTYQKHNKNKEIAKCYNTSGWVNIRNAYLMEHPLCEDCEQEGKVSLAEEVHHVYPVSKGRDLEEMMDICLNPDKYLGLRALCTECHHKIHSKKKKPESL